MKSKIIILMLVIIVPLLIILSDSSSIISQSQPMYVGVNSCVGACHKTESQGNQLSIWQNSKHSQAYLTLQTPQADSIATARGFKTPAVETQECLKCHTLAATVDAGLLTETFDKTQGVQCETCHGPGSEYKKLAVMKDKQQATDAGLIIHTEKEAFCTQCHNSESPSYKEFNYDTFWEKIKHTKPKQ